ncbi:MAG: hypothetical protein FJ207_14105 [Gemmatimonadetes bacterium]|nr:hypothetical protein [Gemmatimonadota bacterium]
MIPARRRSVVLFIGLLGALSSPRPGASQATPDHAAVLERQHPELFDLLLRIERAHGLMFGGLAKEGDAVRASADTLPTFGFELDMVERLTALVSAPGRGEEVAAEAEAGFEVLGKRGAAIITRANAFHREVLGILADPAIPTFAARRAVVEEAVRRYLSEPSIAVPGAPKDMDVLYDHSQALAFRTGYADLDGLIWAGYWLKLAATEPLTDIADPVRRAEGLDTVMTRYQAKLSYGDPPQFFPSELPMAPAIAPGTIFLSPEAAMIWDNVSMMQEVLADILASPRVTDVRGAIELTLDHFTDPNYDMQDQGYWEIMALRHGIFFQGGYPLTLMTESELNVGGHAAHLSGGGAPIIGGMPG